MARTPFLFEPLSLGGITPANRIAASPMCQASAEDGAANDWHLQHLGSLSLSGAGLVIVEQTAVEPMGRISHGCLGLIPKKTRGRWRALSASAGARVRRRSAFSLPMLATRVRRSCRGTAADRFSWTPVPGRRRHHPPSRSTIVGRPRKRSTKLDWRVFVTPMRKRQSARSDWVSIWSNCWARTAFCCTASSPRSPIDERIPTVAAWPTALSARSRCRDPGGLAAPESTRHAHYRHGLGRRRDHA